MMTHAWLPPRPVAAAAVQPVHAQPRAVALHPARMLPGC